MGWLGLLKTLLGLASAVADYMNKKQLLDAGEAKAISEGLTKANEIVKNANKARLSASRSFDDRNGLPDEQDPNLRD